MENINGANMIILDSARKHGISDADMEMVISDPVFVGEIKYPYKMLFLGFDSKARALEVITDIGDSGQLYVIHADKITKDNEKLLKEVLG